MVLQALVLQALKRYNRYIDCSINYIHSVYYHINYVLVFDLVSLF